MGEMKFGLTPTELTRLRAIADAATPGPWRWEVNEAHKSVQLAGGTPKFDKSVMTFARYGMSSAAPVFWFWKDGQNWSEEPKRADAVSIAVPGREHHAKWFKTIEHHDARFIAAAREAVPVLLDEIERLREALKGAAVVVNQATGAERGRV